jgi:hypothetical protein
MTLLLGAKCDGGIVLASDGLCRQLQANGRRRVLNAAQTKIFPFANRSIAVAHHGQNVLDGKAVSHYIAQIEYDTTESCHVRDISAHMRGLLDAVVRKSLQRLNTEGVKDGCGFWIAGYGADDQYPVFEEIYWQPGGGFERLDVAILAEGGDGKAFAQLARRSSSRFDFAEIAKCWPLERWVRYVEQLYDAAATLEGASLIFGGVRSLFTITKDGVTKI